MKLKNIEIRLLQDEEPEDAEYFELQVFNPDEPGGINIRGIGVITDPSFRDQGPSYPTTKPEVITGEDAPQVDLNGSAGLVRVNLCGMKWWRTSI